MTIMYWATLAIVIVVVLLAVYEEIKDIRPLWKPLSKIFLFTALWTLFAYGLSIDPNLNP